MVTHLQPVFVLHSRPYRESSLLVDLLTQKEGRICVIARGAKRSKSGLSSVIQSFIPLVANWRGKGELPTLCQIELGEEIFKLSGRALLSGFYLNELLMRLLHRHDHCENIFIIYKEAIQGLSQVFNQSEESLLRRFERKLLNELGYGLRLTHDAETGEQITKEKSYLYRQEKGFVQLKDEEKEKEKEKEKQKQSFFLGKHLLAIEKEDYSDSETLRQAKRLMRLAFLPLLGIKPIKSREMFRG